VITELVARRAHVTYHDPWVPRINLNGLDLQTQPLTPRVCAPPTAW